MALTDSSSGAAAYQLILLGAPNLHQWSPGRGQQAGSQSSRRQMQLRAAHLIPRKQFVAESYRGLHRI